MNDIHQKLAQVERVLAEASGCLSGALTVLNEVKAQLGKENAPKSHFVTGMTVGELLRKCKPRTGYTDPWSLKGPCNWNTYTH